MSEVIATARDIVNAILSATLTYAERVEIVRALRESTPGVVAPDPRLVRRIHSARGVSVDYVHNTINALESSDVWQSASSSPKDIRHHRDLADEQRPFMTEAQALADLMKYNVGYNHFLAVDKARAAHKVGKSIAGDARISIQPHLDSLEEARPSLGRRRKKTDALTPTLPITKP